MEIESDKKSEPTPFQKFDKLARQVIQVPKKVVDRRAKAARTKRERKRSKDS